MEELESTPLGESQEPETPPSEPAVETQAEPETAAEDTDGGDEDPLAFEATLSVDELMQSNEEPAILAPQEDVQLKAVLEAVIYVSEEPLTVAQIAASLQEPPERIRMLFDQLIAEFEQAGHGICIREIAGGFKMATK